MQMCAVTHDMYYFMRTEKEVHSKWLYGEHGTFSSVNWKRSISLCSLFVFVCQESYNSTHYCGIHVVVCDKSATDLSKVPVLPILNMTWNGTFVKILEL